MVVKLVVTHRRGTSHTTPNGLAAMWCTGVVSTQQTLEVTTQSGIQFATDLIYHHFKTRQAHLQYPRLNTAVYTDTMFAKESSLRGNKCAQVFAMGFDYVHFYPLGKKSSQSCSCQFHYHCQDSEEASYRWHPGASRRRIG
jgi:hypothetical protein